MDEQEVIEPDKWEAARTVECVLTERDTLTVGFDPASGTSWFVAGRMVDGKLELHYTEL
jgi:hypothetical protein